jgi:phosphoglycerate dehydrogenase-like enzyme
MTERVWTNATLPEPAMQALRTGVGEGNLVVSAEATSNLASGAFCPALNQAAIAFGQPDPQQAMQLPNLRWVHLTSAGYTRYDAPEFRSACADSGAVLTNSSSVFDEPCAQHVLAMMLAECRRIPQSVAASRMGSWDYAEQRRRARILQGDTVLILGYGAIGRRLAELLAPFRLRVMGLRRSPRGDEGVPVFGIDRLAEFLPEADHLVNVLPANPESSRLLGRSEFESLPWGARFYNVGRGTTVDQAALIAALRSGQLSAAYLDVTDPEPPVAGDPIWTAPNCFITPHIAGGRQNEAMEMVNHFLGNLERWRRSQPLLDRII